VQGTVSEGALGFEARGLLSSLAADETRVVEYLLTHQQE
jgi:hypothetical protein